jgi:hypothetical protein
MNLALSSLHPTFRTSLELREIHHTRHSRILDLPAPSREKTNPVLPSGSHESARTRTLQTEQNAHASACSSQTRLLPLIPVATPASSPANYKSLSRQLSEILRELNQATTCHIRLVCQTLVTACSPQPAPPLFADPRAQTLSRRR